MDITVEIASSHCYGRSYHTVNYYWNIELDLLSPKQLKKKFICSEHFDKDQYSNQIDVKSGLNANAISKKNYGVEKVDDPVLKTTLDTNLSSPKSWRWNIFNSSEIKHMLIVMSTKYWIRLRLSLKKQVSGCRSAVE
ncbi:hypothetical protein QTP88_029368 [Uroleucon formosanum]